MKTFFRNKKINDSSIPVVLWVLFFCYAISSALLFQKVILPRITSVGASGISLTADSAHFHHMATVLAGKIEHFGWSEWSFYNSPNNSGIIGLLAVLYVIFGMDPAVIVPLNAAVHALGGVLIYLLALELASEKIIGKYAGMIASVLFITFPSSLNWYGQIHKDGYSIFALLLMMLVWVRFLKGGHSFKELIWLFILFMLAIFIALIMKAYVLKIAIIILLVMLCVLSYIHYQKNQTQQIFCYVLMISMLVIAIQLAKVLNASQSDLGTLYSTIDLGGSEVAVVKSWKWQPTSWLPSIVDDQLKLLATTRVGLIGYGLSLKAGSMVDVNILPKNAFELFTYLPRALQVALLMPTPSYLLENLQLTKIVVLLETLVVYASLIGLFPLIFYRANRRLSVFLIALSAFAYLMVYGVSISNLGTLYRIRYLFVFLLVLLGLIGWISYAKKNGLVARMASIFGTRTYHAMPMVFNETISESPRNKVVSKTLVVMSLTLLGLIGFFIRDIMLAQKFGLNSDLDSFFLALVAPMFLVTVIFIPTGNAFVPYMTSVTENKFIDSSKIVSNVSFVFLTSMLIMGVVLYFSNQFILEYFHLKELDSSVQQQLKYNFNLALIVMFSGAFIILGNSLLNALNQVTIPSLVQLVVPIVAVISLILFSDHYGVVSVMWGMVIGQIINLAIIQYFLVQKGYSLIPRLVDGGMLQNRELWIQAFPLIVSSFFTGMVLPINTYLAGTLASGNLSAYNLGSKTIVFISGLVTAGFSAVMLPYFSSVLEKQGVMGTRRELSFFLLLVTFISVPVTIFFFLVAEPLVEMLFKDGAFTDENLVMVVMVVKYSIAQLPFYCSNMLLVKYATATKHSVAIATSAAIGLVLNVILALYLIPIMGLNGIALGFTASALISTAILLSVMFRYAHITFFDMVVLLLNWMLFVTLLIGFHFESMPCVIITSGVYSLLCVLYFMSYKYQSSYGSSIEA